MSKEESSVSPNDKVLVSNVSRLEGKILTFIDALFPPPQFMVSSTASPTPYSQNKAVKDLIKAEFSDLYFTATP